MRESKLKIEIGQEFNRWKVIGESDRKHYWICECQCEKKTIRTIYGYNLRGNKTKSCGCRISEATTERNYKHGLAHHPLFTIWMGIRARCNNVNDKLYQHYGACGITCYNEWQNDFKCFYDWAISNGWKDGLVIDRKNTLYGYAPENCRFCTQSQNSFNTRKRKNTSSKYKGCSFTKDVSKYTCELTKYGKRYRIGYFKSEDAAGLAYNQKAIELFGEYSHLNFFENINTLVLCAGEGRRFQEAGYNLPKPLIDINGKSMLQRVYETNGINCNHIFAVRKEHVDKFEIDSQIKLFANNSEFIYVDKLTEGAACTALLAEPLINNDKELIIYNSDQIIQADFSKWREQVELDNSDACIFVFNADHPKWSYVSLDDNGYVAQIKEKQVISNIATVGWYWWRKGSEFVDSAKEMIAANDRFNEEFYLAPSIQYLINKGKKVSVFYIDKMIGVGTPEDLEIAINL